MKYRRTLLTFDMDFRNRAAKTRPPLKARRAHAASFFDIV